MLFVFLDLEKETSKTVELRGQVIHEVDRLKYPGRNMNYD